MSAARLPDFEHTLAIAQGNLEASELAECHGVACGLLCRRSDASLDAFTGLLGMLELVNDPAFLITDCLLKTMIPAPASEYPSRNY